MNLCASTGITTLIFDGPTLEREDTRRDYGERRVVAIGVAQGICLTVVYTDRTETGGHRSTAYLGPGEQLP